MQQSVTDVLQESFLAQRQILLNRCELKNTDLLSSDFIVFLLLFSASKYLRPDADNWICPKKKKKEKKETHTKHYK